MKAASIIAAVVFLCALGAFATYVEITHAREPDCPSSWPETPAEQFFVDSRGTEWFVIRSADSNGYETVRAYPADAGYQGGYAPGSPHEVCYLLVRRPGSAEDLAEAERRIFRAEREPPDPPLATSSKTLFREFYDRLIPMGPHGANPHPTWNDLWVVFSNPERSCAAAALGEERLAVALQNTVFHEGDPRLDDVILISCLSNDTGIALSFAIGFADIVRRVEASGKENTCIQELLEPAVAALSKHSPTGEEIWSVFALFFGLVSCGLTPTDPPPGLPGE